MAGMIGVGNNMKADALAGMRRLSDLERAREQTEENLDRQDATDKTQNQMSMTAMGATAGGYAYGPIGAVVGGAVGFLAGSLF